MSIRNVDITSTISSVVSTEPQLTGIKNGKFELAGGHRKFDDPTILKQTAADSVLLQELLDRFARALVEEKRHGRLRDKAAATAAGHDRAVKAAHALARSIDTIIESTGHYVISPRPDDLG